MAGIRCVVVESLEIPGGQCTAFYPDKKMYGVPGHPDIRARDFVDLLVRQGLESTTSAFLNGRVDGVSRLSDGSFRIRAAGKTVVAKYIIIATGIGDMVHNAPSDVDGLNEIKSDFIQYYCKNPAIYKGKKVIIAGGGDSAVDMAVLISTIASRVTIVHRRREFACEQAKLEKLHAPSAEISVITDHKIVRLEEMSGVRTVTIRCLNSGTLRDLQVDNVVFCYGFATKQRSFFGLEEAGLLTENFLIKADLMTMETSISGCYAAGDVITYPYKKKNVVACFFEADRCVRAIKGKMS
jgi:thioredoxin reductase (NADPH)